MKRSFRKFVTRLIASGLRDKVEAITYDEAHVSVFDLYEGPRTPSIVAARKKVYRALLDDGKSLNEIARLFDRAPNGVIKLTRGPGPKPGRRSR